MFNESWIVLEALIGSWAYGLNTPESDEDYRGICIPDEIYLRSPFKNFEQYEDPTKDRQIYGITKFVKLARDNNPNIVELLAVDDKFIKTIKWPGKLLRDNVNLFLSAKCKFTFSGYSFSQLQRIKTHKKWLDKIPEKPIEPKRTSSIVATNAMKNMLDGFRDFVAQIVAEKLHKELAYKDIDMELKDLTDMMSHTMADFPMVYFRDYAVKFFKSISKNVMKEESYILLQEEFDYFFKLNEWNQYQTWQKNRNPKRAELEAKYGYDVKHGSHLVRLLKQCENILTKGYLNVWVGDDKDILAVKNGEWTYEYLIKWADDFNEKINDIYNTNSYVIRKSPDNEKIEELYLEIIDRWFCKEEFSA